MKITIDVNDSEIMKNVLNGVTQKEIEAQLISRMKTEAVNKMWIEIIEQFKNKHAVKTFVNVEDMIEELIKKSVKKNCLEYVKNFMDDDFESDHVSEALGEYIETWLENNEISFTFINKTKMKK